MPTSTEAKQYALVCKPQLDKIERAVGRIEASINGNGVPGLRMQVDRLEQDGKRTRGFLKAAWVGISGLAAATIYAVAKS